MSDFAIMPEFPVMTPLGPATCIGLIPGDTDQWVCWINRTQEAWFWSNPNIRRRCNVTNGLRNYSGFLPQNRETQEHIDRYKKAGWLPQNFDPTDVTTWPM